MRRHRFKRRYGRSRKMSGYRDWEESVVDKLLGKKFRPITRSELVEAYQAGVSAEAAAKKLLR